MKLDMVEFLLHASGVTTQEMIHLNQRMPHGQIVYGPKYVPKHLRPMFEGHKTYPELSRQYSPLFGAMARVAAPPLLVAYPFVTATAHYPLIAGAQYQSAMSGQIGIGSSALNMRKPESWQEVFTLSYWQGY